MSVRDARTIPPHEARHAALAAEVGRVRERLERWGSGGETQGDEPGDDRVEPSRADEIGDNPIDDIAGRFALSPFERDILALAAAVELEGAVATLVNDAQAGVDCRPTFALALAALAGPHWDALAPGSPLRRWHLVELAAGQTLASRPLILDERVLHHLTGPGLTGTGLTGVPAPDARLCGVLRLATTDVVLSASQHALAAELVATLTDLAAPALVVLDGDDADGLNAVTRRLAVGLGGLPFVIRAAALPAAGPELAAIACLVDRELILEGGVPIIEPAAGAEQSVDELIGLLTATVVVHLGEPRIGHTDRVVLRRSVGFPTPAEQHELWRDAVGVETDVDGDLLSAIDDVAQHYRLGAASIVAVARELGTREEVGARSGGDLQRLCRLRCRVDLDGLAERIDATATWDDLVLPAGQMELLRDLVRQVRHRHQVYEEWGFAGPARRGLGVTALFSGDSGTGKTLAAQVLAGELGLDLYRIDLSATVSKYIGETEKNLKRLFDAAETSGAVLLFDEADALFGKRGEVKHAHDRYANLEVAYLLGRMESYRGLALLTTNLRNNLDRAFLRRLRFVVQFPFPDEGQRALIWSRMFPAGAPTKGLEPAALARLAVAGGGIRSIAVSAAFAAADEGSPITVAHVIRAAEIEYTKSDRALADVERAALS